MQANRMIPLSLCISISCQDTCEDSDYNCGESVPFFCLDPDSTNALPIIPGPPAGCVVEIPYFLGKFLSIYWTA
jgi:hypothetical protein